MSFSKLKRIHVIIIGVVVIALVGVGMYFTLIKKANERLAAETQRYDGFVAQKGTIEDVQMAKVDLEKANMEVEQAQAGLDRYMRSRMPNISLARRDLGMLALWREQSQVLGPLIVKHIGQSKVRLSSTISIPAPTTNPNDASLTQVPIVLNIGSVTVHGSYKNLMDHIRSWNKFNRLVKIDNPNLSGVSPLLTCTYNLTVYIYPQSEAGPPIVMAGGGGAPAEAGGGMGPAGYPGGPGGPPPGGTSPYGPGSPAMMPPPQGPG